MDYKKEYEKWCTDAYFDDATKAELKAIAGDEKEIEDRFYRTLEFGTAGLRGVIGAGTNRMNIYTVRQATQGLANYILSQNQGLCFQKPSSGSGTFFCSKGTWLYCRYRNYSKPQSERV